MNQLQQFFAPALAVATLMAASGRTEAALMVYEGFTGYSTASPLIGQSPNANSIGLDPNEEWKSSNSENTLVVSGLAFGSGNILETSGGAIQGQNTASTSASAKFNIAASHLNGSGQFQGTMYSSFLVRQTGAGPGLNHNAHVVVFNGSSTGTRRFRSLAATDAGTTSPIGVDYVGTTPVVTGAGTINDSSQTFMILSRFTQVGQTIDPLLPSTHGVGTVWALTSAQFDYFKANDWAGIDGATVGSGSTQVRGKAAETHTAATANNLLNNTLWWTIGSGSTAEFNNVTFDELRMGTSFNDVTPVIPEPSSIALVALGLAGVGLARRAKRK